MLELSSSIIIYIDTHSIHVLYCDIVINNEEDEVYVAHDRKKSERILDFSISNENKLDVP